MGFVMLLSSVLAGVVGIAVGYYVRKIHDEKKILSTKKIAEQIVEEAKREAETKKREVLAEAREEALRIRHELERELKERRSEIQRAERRLEQREESLDRKLENLTKKEEELKAKLTEVEKAKLEAERLLRERIVKLEEVAGLSREEAKELLLKEVEEEVSSSIGLKLKELEENFKREADKKAREILTTAIQRCAVDHTSEVTVSVVPLPSDDMKGRIIGREGRNIRAFESLTGVDLIVDDTPEAVTLSCFDPVRREIARISLERLILDGRIHPARIEEIVEKVRKEVDEHMLEAAENALLEVNIEGVHPEIVKTLGRLTYRSSYGQNALAHSLEVAHLAGVMAAELGLDEMIARRAGLLHDIGKAIDCQVEGSHALIGADLAKRYGESQVIVNAIAAHHEEEEPKSVYAVLVLAADAVSASRPGARRESIEAYIRRLEKLENLASSFTGVEKAYAIQAGREVRVMISPEAGDDGTIYKIAYDIARKIEEDLKYPGQVKVTVIRELRAIEFAK
ncbi:ribonuclease Y [Acetomicrobium sp.]|uniref:ribonuclease Y n=1 Tax=Acetomicrobium sp. TaxID=1872099 RepID=UPI002870F38D|nr:ribonuclease Y [Acetomicrobium sp.]MDR9770273.1 ribonuclease Y [Acetomicrobium sp.]